MNISNDFNNIENAILHDGKVRWRLDFDDEIGVHYNFEDFSKGKGNKAVKKVIPIDISYMTFI